jgi:hypothetical protein
VSQWGEYQLAILFGDQTEPDKSGDRSAIPVSDDLPAFDASQQDHFPGGQAFREVYWQCGGHFDETYVGCKLVVTRRFHDRQARIGQKKISVGGHHQTAAAQYLNVPMAIHPERRAAPDAFEQGDLPVAQVEDPAVWRGVALRYRVIRSQGHLSSPFEVH